MNVNSTFYLLACLTLGGCMDAEQAPEGDESGVDKPETDEPETGTTEQAVGPQTHYDIRSFGGNLFAENFYYAVGGLCSQGNVRSTVGTRWTAQVGGYCGFVGWLTPADPHDCRAT